MMPPDLFALLARALGFAVVHSLWQIAFVWIIFRAITRFLRHRNNAVYLLALGCMLVSAVWATVTFSTEFRHMSQHAASIALDQPLTASTVSATNTRAFTVTDTSSDDIFTLACFWFERHAGIVGSTWLLCASLLWLRLLGGWWLAQRLKRQGVSSPDKSFQDLCKVWADRLHIRQTIRLLESTRVSEPLTFGFWKPVILFPLGMFAHLSPAQVEALLLHELAHIRRYDYLVNLVQLALEVCFFYHPLFWLLSREARTRREYCCDDVVLRHTSNPLLYAKTLTDLQLSFVHNQNQFVMTATGKKHFTERILRIAGITPKRSFRSNWLLFVLLPLFAALSSWWPAPQTSLPDETPEIVSYDIAVPVRDIEKTASGAEPKPEAGRVPAAGDTVVPGATYVVATAPLKMNVFYIGVDNPLRVAASGIPAAELSPRLVGAGTLTGSNGEYVVQVAQPGEVFIRVYRVQGQKETLLSEQTYRVKRIPDPTPKLGGQFTSTSRISLKTLKEMPGIEAVLENFLFDATCEVVGFGLTVVPKMKDPTYLEVTGGQFPPRAIQLFNSLDSLGGAVFMDDIKVRCPGDASSRNVGGLAFKIGIVE